MSQDSLWLQLQSLPAEAVALRAPERPALSHGELRALIERSVQQLNAWGIGRNERVAIVLPNGPEMAACF
ncbi:MAG TPA: hypothetical protein VK195_09490, partial [Burkholderiaceae bacterium]|nr:hypothetical protein [Burkholderiaceae bacterium]